VYGDYVKRNTRAAHTSGSGLFACSWKEKEHLWLFTENTSLASEQSSHTAL